MVRKVVIASVSLAVLVAVAGCATLAMISSPRPESAPSEEADALAREVQGATGIEGWRRTGAARFQLRDGAPKFLWDRTRGLVRADYGQEVFYLRTADRSGVLVRDGEKAAASDEELARAWARFVNDSYWLWPFGGFFDEGVTRSIVEVEDGRGLLIEYASGGVTPGDAYVWIVGDDGVPTAWRVWASALPLKGAEFTWEDWQVQPTGVRFARKRRLFGLGGEARAEAAATLAEIEPGPDPFAPLVGEPAAASQPAE
jgi:hypothetical protein